MSFLEHHRKYEFEFLKDHANKQSFTQELCNYTNDKLTFHNLREQVMNTEGRLKIGPNYGNFLREPRLRQGADADDGRPEYRFH